MKKGFRLLPIILFVATNSFAQLGEITGVVKDKDTGEPIWNVSVYVDFAGRLIGDAADFDGRYTIAALNSGTYTVITKMPGYAPVKIKGVLVTSGKASSVNVEMTATAELLPTFEMVEHIIPLIDKYEPGIQHVDPKSFQRDPNRLDPIKAIAGLTAGVQLAPNGKDVIIRGARPTSTQFITDGVKSRTGEIGIPGLAVGSVKVYTGGIPATYGDVTGGVIVVETKSYFDLAQKFK